MTDHVYPMDRLHDYTDYRAARARFNDQTRNGYRGTRANVRCDYMTRRPSPVTALIFGLYHVFGTRRSK